jgi:hypothetical protein
MSITEQPILTTEDDYLRLPLKHTFGNDISAHDLIEEAQWVELICELLLRLAIDVGVTPGSCKRIEFDDMLLALGKHGWYIRHTHEAPNDNQLSAHQEGVNTLYNMLGGGGLTRDHWHATFAAAGMQVITDNPTRFAAAVGTLFSLAEYGDAMRCKQQEAVYNGTHEGTFEAINMCLGKLTELRELAQQ